MAVRNIPTLKCSYPECAGSPVSILEPCQDKNCTSGKLHHFCQSEYEMLMSIDVGLSKQYCACLNRMHLKTLLKDGSSVNDNSISTGSAKTIDDNGSNQKNDGNGIKTIPSLAAGPGGAGLETISEEQGSKVTTRKTPHQ